MAGTDSQSQSDASALLASDAAGVRHFRDTPEDAEAVRALIEDAITSGDLPGFQLGEVRAAVDQSSAVPTQTFVALDGAQIVGVYLVNWPLLVVAPGARRRGHGRALVLAALAHAEQPETVELSPSPLRPGAEAFARALGFSYHASLWRLRLPANVAVAAPQMPEGYTVREFRPGADDEAYLQTVLTSFATHPSPLVLNLELMQRAHANPAFSPADIAVVTPREDDTQIVAFSRLHFSAEEAEIGLIGVLPEQRGLGLGRELLRWGVSNLRARGADDVVLNVEGRNEHALTLYLRHGFLHDAEWPRWTLAGASATEQEQKQRAT